MRSPWGIIVAVCLFASLTPSAPAFAQGFFGLSPTPSKPPVKAPPPVSPAVIAQRRANEWVIGLAGGSLRGTFLQVASDIARVVDEGEKLRVVGMLTEGSTQNVYSLLFVPNVDIAVVSADAFAQVHQQGKVKNVAKRVQYITQLYVNSLQVLARPDITKLDDLQGKKVAIAEKGSTAANLALKVLERNGVKPQVSYIGWRKGIAKVQSGEFAAVFATFVKGEDTLYSRIKNPKGMHLLSVSMDKMDKEHYIPVVLEYDDYNNLIAPGDQVQTIGNPVVLAVRNLSKKHARYRKVARFVDRFFENYRKLKVPPYHSAFKNIDVSKKVPGWERYWYAETVLKKHLATRVKTTSSVTSKTAAALTKRQERLFREFLEWKNMHLQR
ncbi:MAG: TAXI family TRAP transporter solute-binding subunit [Alphaproteobacteria bacterium]